MLQPVQTHKEAPPPAALTKTPAQARAPIQAAASPTDDSSPEGPTLSTGQHQRQGHQAPSAADASPQAPGPDVSMEPSFSESPPQPASPAAKPEQLPGRRHNLGPESTWAVRQSAELEELQAALDKQRPSRGRPPAHGPAPSPAQAASAEAASARAMRAEAARAVTASAQAASTESASPKAQGICLQSEEADAEPK